MYKYLNFRLLLFDDTPKQTEAWTTGLLLFCTMTSTRLLKKLIAAQQHSVGITNQGDDSDEDALKDRELIVSIKREKSLISLKSVNQFFFFFLLGFWTVSCQRKAPRQSLAGFNPHHIRAHISAHVPLFGRPFQSGSA
jgi:hypothetical protein